MAGTKPGHDGRKPRVFEHMRLWLRALSRKGGLVRVAARVTFRTAEHLAVLAPARSHIH